MYLYIDFLYSDVLQDCYRPQVEASIERYKRIDAEERKSSSFSGFSSIWFSGFGPPNYTGFNAQYLDLVLKGVDDPVFGRRLLFNQIKVLVDGNEVGYSNKSSFCGESLGSFINGSSLSANVPFYVIGDFAMHWTGAHSQLLDNVTSLICYDTDVILNLPVQQQPNKKELCLFISNTYNTLPTSIEDRKKRFGIFDKRYACADPNGGLIRGAIKDSVKAYMTGVFETTDKNLFPLTAVAPMSVFCYQFPIAAMAINEYKINVFKFYK